MPGTVLAFPEKDRSHTCSIRDLPLNYVPIERQAAQPLGSATSSMFPPIPDMLRCLQVGRCGLSPYHGGDLLSRPDHMERRAKLN